LSRPEPITTPAIPRRDVRARRVGFEYPAETMPRHFIGGDLLMSHIVAVLSAFFPEGEDYFVRSVRNYRDRIEDPELKAQVAGFIGQEVTHSREHRNFNERLASLGYPTRFVDRRTKHGLALNARLAPERVRLAITAALEHYTATLAYVLLTDPQAQAMFDIDEVRSMFQWHALEEIEHKSVAFDVFQTVCGDEALRVRAMRVVTFLFLTSAVLHTLGSLLLDRSAYRPRTLIASARRLRRSPFLRREVVRLIRDYNRPGFHPDDHDTSALIVEWRQRLFGPSPTSTSSP
jgi:predicted metal-dependent hydrolase